MRVLVSGSVKTLTGIHNATRIASSTSLQIEAERELKERGTRTFCRVVKIEGVL